MKINRDLIEKGDSQATGKGANEKEEGWGACATVKQMLLQKAFYGTQGDRGGGRSSSSQDQATKMEEQNLKQQSHHRQLRIKQDKSSSMIRKKGTFHLFYKLAQCSKQTK